jgi:hypothetical protein
MFNPGIKPSSSDTIDPAQFAALQAVVTSVLAAMASEKEMARKGAGRAWINEVSGVSQKAILEVVGVPDKFKQEVTEHINLMLKGIKV